MQKKILKRHFQEFLASSVPSLARKNTHHGRIWGLNMSSTWEAWILQWSRQRDLRSGSHQASSIRITQHKTSGNECGVAKRSIPLSLVLVAISGPNLENPTYGAGNLSQGWNTSLKG